MANPKSIGIGIALALLLGGGAYAMIGPDGPAENPAPTAEPDPVISTVPLSGSWGMVMQIGNLTGAQCPTAPQGTTSNGTALLQVSTDGSAATLLIQDTVYPTNGLFLNEVYRYYSQWRNFPTFDENGNSIEGTARIEFYALTPEQITGELIWNNNAGCQGNYPITLTFGQPEAFSEFVLTDGTFNTEVEEPVDCDDTSISFGNYAGFPSGPIEIVNEIDLDAFDAGTPSDTLVINPGGGQEITLYRVPGTNQYQQNLTGGDDFTAPGTEFPLQSAPDTLDYNQSITGQFEGIILEDGSFQGNVTGTGPEGCTYSTGFTFTPPGDIS